ncbi:MAG: response regulator transcription factor [Niameybacter sp.]|uniref:response regulator transcription factor n=1 Tax=Niameybacter sp. TaxID=2033640 RepID=UPI002FC807A9
MTQILLVEDDDAIAIGVTFALEKEGYKVHVAPTIKEAKTVLNEKVSLILLDLNLPDGIGYSFCEHVKSISEVPIIFLTVRDDEEEMIKGLDMGADDYITKPFKMRILLSRIQAVLRRAQKDVSHILICKSIRLDKNQGRVYKRDEEVVLSKSEFKLLLLLMENKECTVSREHILEYLWGVDGEFVNDNTLTVMVKRLREKIEEPEEKLIQTIRGVGYRLES